MYGYCFFCQPRYHFLMESIDKIVNFGRSDREPMPEHIQLQDGKPLYHLFIDTANGPGFVSNDESEDAHERLRELFAIDREKVLSCDGKTEDEARKILDSIHTSQDEEREDLLEAA